MLLHKILKVHLFYGLFGNINPFMDFYLQIMVSNMNFVILMYCSNRHNIIYKCFCFLLFQQNVDNCDITAGKYSKTKKFLI